MNRFSILVRNINNLTDARYFAAWQPEYLALSKTDDIDALKRTLAALTPWIEGPKWALELPNVITPNLLQGLTEIAKIGVEAVIGSESQLKDLDTPSLSRLVKAEKDTDIMAASQIESAIILTVDQAATMVANESNRTLYVEVENVEDWQKCLPIKEQIQGIVLSGSDEEKVGWKSFDQVDDLLELIFQSMELN